MRAGLVQVRRTPKPDGGLDVKLKNKGNGTYRTHDGGAEVVANAGDEFEVSDARGEQILADFPDQFELVGAVKGKKAKE